MQEPPSADAVLRRDAFDLLAALDAYDLATTRLIETWLDMEAYADFSRQIESIREHGVADASLTVLSLQLVIAHSELVLSLWQDACVGVAAPALQGVRERHAGAIAALRLAALRLAAVRLLGKAA